MIERGIIPINPPELESIYKQFQVSINWLITGDGEKRKNKFISDDEDVQELETFLMTFPWFITELKSNLKKLYKEKKERLDEETKAFLIKFTGHKKNETNA